MVRRLTQWERADYMQFTITSRVEIPNEEFAAEISRATEDLSYSLYSPGDPGGRAIWAASVISLRLYDG